MRITLVSAPVRNGDVEFNVGNMEDCIEAHRGRTDLIVFGESCLQGFDSLCWDYRRDRETACTLESAVIGRLRSAAARSGVAVSFGFIEREGDRLFSSQLFIGSAGETVADFHRVSVGWKDCSQADEHYCEGSGFEKFAYRGLTFAIGLCGDLWTPGRPEEMQSLDSDVVLWPVWCNYSPDEWKNSARQEYAEQADLCGSNVLFVNPYCADEDAPDAATGGALHLSGGRVMAECEPGGSGGLTVEIPDEKDLTPVS